MMHCEEDSRGAQQVPLIHSFIFILVHFMYYNYFPFRIGPRFCLARRQDQTRMFVTIMALRINAGNAIPSFDLFLTCRKK
jgi:hypothetical protein